MFPLGLRLCLDLDTFLCFLRTPWLSGYVSRDFLDICFMFLFHYSLCFPRAHYVSFLHFLGLRCLPPHPCFLQHPPCLFSLTGVRIHLSRVYMVIKLWFFKHFAQQKTPGYMLSFLKRKPHFDHHVPRDQIVITFEKKKPLWSQCTQRSHSDHIWKENSTKTSGFFVKENPGFFHNFVHNVSTQNLSHSLRLLS